MGYLKKPLISGEYKPVVFKSRGKGRRLTLALKQRLPP